MVQNPDPHDSPQRFLHDRGIMGDCEPNTTIRDTVNPSNPLTLLPQDDSSFDITHFTVE